MICTRCYKPIDTKAINRAMDEGEDYFHSCGRRLIKAKPRPDRNSNPGGKAV